MAAGQINYPFILRVRFAKRKAYGILETGTDSERASLREWPRVP